MGLKFATKVDRIRPGAGTALAFFNLAIGVNVDGTFTPLIIAKDFALRDGENGKWIASPSRKYDKDGETKYANYFEFHAEKVGEKWKLTDAASGLQKKIVAQVVEAYEAMNAESGGRGGSKPQGANTKAEKSASKGGGIFDDADDAGDGGDFDLF